MTYCCTNFHKTLRRLTNLRSACITAVRSQGSFDYFDDVTLPLSNKFIQNTTTLRFSEREDDPFRSRN
jgi:hypothetical protein